MLSVARAYAFLAADQRGPSITTMAPAPGPALAQNLAPLPGWRFKMPGRSLFGSGDRWPGSAGSKSGPHDRHLGHMAYI